MHNAAPRACAENRASLFTGGKSQAVLERNAPWEKMRLVEMVLEYPEKPPCELANYITDTCEYYTSEPRPTQH
jgi:hypothetical protein